MSRLLFFNGYDMLRITPFVHFVVMTSKENFKWSDKMIHS
jgi:hypothetical protein